MGETSLWLAAMILAAALLYSSVGHGGASAYLAAMALMAVEPAVMKPTALCLNILVAGIATYKFARAKCLSWQLLWPFAVLSVPLAYVGGWISLPSHAYRPLVGAVLLFAAARLLLGPPRADAATRAPRRAVCLVSGAAIGLLAGLTGTGGGIFLSPLVLLMGWAEPRHTAGLSAAFILVNSLAGLAGHLTRWVPLPLALPLWAIAAVTGGLVGSHYGSRHLKGTVLRRLLALVLAVAGLKLLVTF